VVRVFDGGEQASRARATLVFQGTQRFLEVLLSGGCLRPQVCEYRHIFVQEHADVEEVDRILLNAGAPLQLFRQPNDSI
jgi:hypothetical protein